MSISRSTFLLAVVVASAVTSAAVADDLAASVAGSLRDTNALQGHRVSVKAKGGTVWLEGQVGDAGQIAKAVAAARATEGVERVVNKLKVSEEPATGLFNSLAIPSSIRSAAGLSGKKAPDAERSAGTGNAARQVQLTQAVGPTRGAGQAGPRPLGEPTGRPMQPHASMRGPTGRQNVAMQTGAMSQSFNLPGPGGYAGGMGNGAEGGAGIPGGLQNGQVVPGSVRYSEGGPADAYGGGPGPGGPYAGGPMNGAPMNGAPYAAGPGPGGPGGGLGAPMPARGMGVAGGPVPMRGDGPNVPNYAWPSYAASPNYAAVQYPTQYSPTAWPYIGPFYPYPQVPLGWRRVSLEWDDGWWWLDFDERHVHSHHR